jgi:endonuclease/exonuclease/phosphatase (EEP) superfamily protein YafD
MLRALAMLAWATLALTILALGIGRLGAICYACDAINILLPMLIVASALALLLACVLTGHDRIARRWLAAFGCLFLLVALRSPIPPAPSCPARSTDSTLHVLEFNAWELNRTPGAAVQWILGQHPDAIILLEAKQRAASLPAQLQRAYPYRVACLPALPCSTLILSRIAPLAVYPLGRGDVENRQGLSAAAMVLGFSGRQATIVGVHLSRPLPWGRQSRELAQLKAALASFDPHTLVLGGDFNSTPDTALLRQAAADLDLRMIPTGATWPTAAARLWAASFLSLDHVLVGDGWRVAAASVGPTIGSDHRPIMVSLCRNPG